jgi:DNA-binding NarL/FixJ family response regulator
MRTTYQAALDQPDSAAAGPKGAGMSVASTTSLARRRDLGPALVGGGFVPRCPGPGAARTVRVLIVDDHALVRDGLHALLSREPDLEVVAETSDPDEAIELVSTMRPDVVVIGIGTNGANGFDATRRVTAEVPSTRVLVLTTCESEEGLFEALRAGASGFLTKDADVTELAHAVRLIERGGALLSPSATRSLIADFCARPENRRGDAHGLEWLTPRESEVMALAAAGLTNDEIAAHLVISPATAKTHVSRAMRKLHCHDRVGLVVRAYESGLLRPAYAARMAA